MSSTNEEWFIVKDLDSFIESTRALVYNNFGQWNKSNGSDLIDSMIVKPSDIEEFNKILSKEESLTIIKNLLKKQKNKHSRQIRYLVSDPIFLEIIHNLNDRITSNILNNLVSKGLVESAYDSELDDFIFWIKDDVKKEIKKPDSN